MEYGIEIKLSNNEVKCKSNIKNEEYMLIRNSNYDYFGKSNLLKTINNYDLTDEIKEGLSYISYKENDTKNYTVFNNDINDTNTTSDNFALTVENKSALYNFLENYKLNDECEYKRSLEQMESEVGEQITKTCFYFDQNKEKSVIYSWINENQLIQYLKSVLNTNTVESKITINKSDFDFRKVEFKFFMGKIPLNQSKNAIFDGFIFMNKSLSENTYERIIYKGKTRYTYFEDIKGIYYSLDKKIVHYGCFRNNSFIKGKIINNVTSTLNTRDIEIYDYDVNENSCEYKRDYDLSGKEVSECLNLVAIINSEFNVTIHDMQISSNVFNLMFDILKYFLMMIILFNNFKDNEFNVKENDIENEEKSQYANVGKNENDSWNDFNVNFKNLYFLLIENYKALNGLLYIEK